MGTLRSLERQVIRNKCYRENGNTKMFHDEWEKYHYPRQEIVQKNGETITIAKKKGLAGKKKQEHFDDGKKAFRFYKAMKEYIAKQREEKAEGKETRVSNKEGELVNG